MNLVKLFCDVDDFCQTFRPHWQQQLLQSKQRKRLYPTQMDDSEIMTTVIHFHQSSYRNFKMYYLNYVCKHLPQMFPRLLSYTRFVERMSGITVLLCAYLTHRYGQPAGIAFIDSPQYVFVIIYVFPVTLCSRMLRVGEKPQPAGFTGSNCI